MMNALRNYFLDLRDRQRITIGWRACLSKRGTGS